MKEIRDDLIERQGPQPSAEELRGAIREIDRIAKILERMNISDYVGLLKRPWRLLWLNFLAGLGRGLGAILGATLLFSIIIALVSRMVGLHLPGIGRFLEEFLRLFHPGGGR